MIDIVKVYRENEKLRNYWAESGVFVEKYNIDPTTKRLHFWITVPERSVFKDATGNALAGDYLAKKIKREAVSYGLPADTKFYSALRRGDVWDQSKKNQAGVAIKACFETKDDRPFDEFKKYLNKKKTTSNVYNIFNAVGNMGGSGDPVHTRQADTEPRVIDVPNLAEDKK